MRCCIGVGARCVCFAATSFVRFILIKRKNGWASDNSPEAIAEIESGHLVY